MLHGLKIYFSPNLGHFICEVGEEEMIAAIACYFYLFFYFFGGKEKALRGL